MRILIAEDEMISRRFIGKFMSNYGECDITVDGSEAIDVFELALEEENPYDLVCLDIMMPEVDGLQALKEIRKLEQNFGIKEENRVKIIMTTALNDVNNIKYAFKEGSEGYCVKPIDTKKLLQVMERLGLIKNV